ncbi:lycopene cyclase domain-containing protein [Cellulomonas soli]|uniref:lycopene cyclase domain-containing protein n=1 Tax=Cellulomonas soli TaxID=931535 RepID=UPI003F84CAD0
MTNIVLNVLVLVALVAVSFPVLRRLRGWPIVWTALHLSLLTVVFDTLMIRIGLYVYAPDKILGVYLGGAPLEDFAYPLAAAVGIPVLWTVLGPRAPRRPGRDAAQPSDDVPAENGHTA